MDIPRKGAARSRLIPPPDPRETKRGLSVGLTRLWSAPGFAGALAITWPDLTIFPRAVDILQ